MISLLTKCLVTLVWLHSSLAQDPFTFDKSSCLFPFEFNGKLYYDCLPADTSVRKFFPWCSTTSKYMGVWNYCINYAKSTWNCTADCTVVTRYPQCTATNGRIKYCLEKAVDLSVKPVGSCSAEYSSISPFHTVCLPPRPNVAKTGITDLDKVEILNVHNKYRRSTVVPATRMQKLYWDDDLAFVAQKHASRCQFSHDDGILRSLPGRGIIPGQNIMYITSLDSFATEFDRLFDAEIIRWDFEKGLKYEYKIFNQTAGHYIQLVIEEASRVGCGYAECVFYNRIDRALVCNYNYAFRTHDEKIPYVNGTRCSGCPTKCDNGLCDCKGMECWNGGTLDVNTCKCTCDPFFTGARCETPLPAGLDSQGCFFPFSYEGQVYFDCADWGGGDVWCSTTKYWGDGDPADIACKPKAKRKRGKNPEIGGEEMPFDTYSSGEESMFSRPVDEKPHRQRGRRRRNIN